ncbi:MAG: hypothetical protein WAU44_10980 [Nitrospira sp.]|jgi:hypothetical protein|uniref:hypothetical protein n=1 Tax=Nitrospira sp. ND1 TaxID=1658518 RepID=UPI0009BC634C|nr:hypothetical protein [Nitrospira sp. ND1]MBK7419748.1 hypothetical protein [Nitrospira sp.]MBK7486648.1 hypothetical protein [Nitrospira sp.]MBK9111311.1 hypothetical protein [Nitrospira sp.]MBK9999483.1 hypothetical protein [Nitrospira sp.]MBP6199202.1 hypothetical protein [Nitrospira sp.]
MDPLEKTSHACRAAALSLVPGLGHLYIGEKRGGPLFLAGVLLIVLWMAVFSVALVPLIGLVLFCMGDTYLTVSRDRGLLA